MVFTRRMSVRPTRTLNLEFTSEFEMLDFVQVACDRFSRDLGLDDDTVHWVGVAVREGVINAIKHGNGSDAAKRVFVEFQSWAAPAVELVIRVRDQGPGFDPGVLADPLAPENLLKASGRGIFLIRSFMDDVQMERAPGGGMELRMTKRAPSPGAAHSSPLQ
jgi:serine/threonine-protein kinase RsbW